MQPWVMACSCLGRQWNLRSPATNPSSLIVIAQGIGISFSSQPTHSCHRHCAQYLSAYLFLFLNWSSIHTHHLSKLENIFIALENILYFLYFFSLSLPQTFILISIIIVSFTSWRTSYKWNHIEKNTDAQLQ